MLGKKDKDPCYLVVWFDPSDRMVKHEVLSHDKEAMHGYANERRHEIKQVLDQVMGDEVSDPANEADLIHVFEVKDPKPLAGALELVFREGD